MEATGAEAADAFAGAVDGAEAASPAACAEPTAQTAAIKVTKTPPPADFRAAECARQGTVCLCMLPSYDPTPRLVRAWQARLSSSPAPLRGKVVGLCRCSRRSPERVFKRFLHHARWVLTALAFDCNPTHFVTPWGPLVAHNASARDAFVSNCCAPAGFSSQQCGARQTRLRCKVTPPFRIDPSKGFPVRAVLPGPRAFFCLRNLRSTPHA